MNASMTTMIMIMMMMIIAFLLSVASSNVIEVGADEQEERCSQDGPDWKPSLCANEIDVRGDLSIASEFYVSINGVKIDMLERWRNVQTSLEAVETENDALKLKIAKAKQIRDSFFQPPSPPPPSPPPSPPPPSPPPSLNSFLQTKAVYSRLDIDNHVSGGYVYDTAVNISWSAHSAQKPSIVVVDGKSCLDMVSTGHIFISPPSNYPVLGQYYTQFYIWKPRTSDSNWRALYINNYYNDYLTIIKSGSKDLGCYSNGRGGFRDSGYDIVVQWQVLIGVSATGTTSYYVNDENGAAVSVGTSDLAASGFPLAFFGYSGQYGSYAPGYFIEAGILNEALDSTEIQELMSILVNKMESSASSSS
jgi:hypothetical protein